MKYKNILELIDNSKYLSSSFITKYNVANIEELKSNINMNYYQNTLLDKLEQDIISENKFQNLVFKPNDNINTNINYNNNTTTNNYNTRKNPNKYEYTLNSQEENNNKINNILNKYKPIDSKLNKLDTLNYYASNVNDSKDNIRNDPLLTNYSNYDTKTVYYPNSREKVNKQNALNVIKIEDNIINNNNINYNNSITIPDKYKLGFSKSYNYLKKYKNKEVANDSSNNNDKYDQNSFENNRSRY